MKCYVCLARIFHNLKTNKQLVYFVVQTTANEHLPTRRWRNTIYDPFSLKASLVTLRGECGRLRWASTLPWPRSEHVGDIRPGSRPSGNFRTDLLLLWDTGCLSRCPRFKALGVSSDILYIILTMLLGSCRPGGWRGKLVKGEALRTHHQVFSIRFKNITVTEATNALTVQ